LIKFAANIIISSNIIILIKNNNLNLIDDSISRPKKNQPKIPNRN
jgi:hypothetical protein